MAYEDKTIVCSDCGAEFTHTAEDQARYAERGFTNDPKRCRECREKRKARQQQQQPDRGHHRGGGGLRQGRGGGGGGRGGFGRGGSRGGGGGGGQRRPLFEAVCSQCGVTTTVPFKPVEGRPVYCRDCYRDQRG